MAIAPINPPYGVGSLSKIVPLMTEEMVFLIEVKPPTWPRDAFVAVCQAENGKVRIEPKMTIKEINVAGGLAYCWYHLQVNIALLSDGSPMHRLGSTLTVLRKQPDGWTMGDLSRCQFANPDVLKSR